MMNISDRCKKIYMVMDEVYSWGESMVKCLKSGI